MRAERNIVMQLEAEAAAAYLKSFTALSMPSSSFNPTPPGHALVSAAAAAAAAADTAAAALATATIEDHVSISSARGPTSSLPPLIEPTPLSPMFASGRGSGAHSSSMQGFSPRAWVVHENDHRSACIMLSPLQLADATMAPSDNDYNSAAATDFHCDDDVDMRAGSHRIIMGGSIVHPDPHLHHAAAAAAAAAEAAALRIFAKRHHGQDIVCVGVPVGEIAARDTQPQTTGRAAQLSPPPPFSLEELRVKYKQASDRARR
jgi:hypothetical protein